MSPLMLSFLVACGKDEVTDTAPPPLLAPSSPAAALWWVTTEGETDAVAAPAPPPPPATFTVGVTDYTFNWVNAIFGRLLKTKDGHFITLAYWQQQDKVSNDEVPYYEQS